MYNSIKAPLFLTLLLWIATEMGVGKRICTFSEERDTAGKPQDRRGFSRVADRSRCQQLCQRLQLCTAVEYIHHSNSCFVYNGPTTNSSRRDHLFMQKKCKTDGSCIFLKEDNTAGLRVQTTGFRQVPAEDDCQAFCLMDEGCLAVEFQIVNTQCHFYNADVDKHFEKEVSFFTKVCLKTDPQAESSPAASIQPSATMTDVSNGFDPALANYSEVQALASAFPDPPNADHLDSLASKIAPPFRVRPDKDGGGQPPRRRPGGRPGKGRLRPTANPREKFKGKHPLRQFSRRKWYRRRRPRPSQPMARRHRQGRRLRKVRRQRWPEPE